MFRSSVALALVRRELLTGLRRTRSFVLLMVFLAAAVFMVAATWPEAERQFVQAQEFGTQLLTQLYMLLFGACLLFVPGLAAGAIVLEREQDTLDLLLSTLIRPGSLVLGKLVNAMGFFLLFVLSALPVMSVVFFVVGLEWRDVASAMLVLLFSAGACGAVGVLCSAWFRRPYGAIAGSYLGVVVLQLLGPVFGFFAILLSQPFSARMPSLTQALGMALELGSPFATLAAVLRQQLSIVHLSLALLYQLAIMSLCLWLARRALARPPAPPKINAFKPIDDPLVLRARRNTFPYYLIDPLRRKKPVEDNLNPMLVKELRWGLTNSAGRLIRIFYWSLGGYFLAGLPSMYAEGDFESMRGFIFFQIALTLLITPALLANALTKEYEMGNMDMLRMTLLRPRQIVVGKLSAGLITVLPIALGAALAGLPAALVVEQRGSLLLTGYGTLTLCCLICLCLSLAASMLTRRTVTALVLTYAMVALLFLGTWVLSLYLYDPQFTHQNGGDLEGVRYWFQSPLVVFMTNAGLHRKDTMVTSLWLGNVAVFLGLCAGLVALSVASFHRFRLRDV